MKGGNMKNIQIEIGDLQYDVLKQYSEANSLTIEQYVGNIILGWVNSHIQGFYIDKIKELPFQELETKLGKVDLKKKGTI